MIRRILAVALGLLAVAGGLAAGYVWLVRDGETRLAAFMEQAAAAAAPVANLRYGAIDYDPVQRRATIEGVTIAWRDADVEIGAVILDELPLGVFDPRRGRMAVRDLKDRGLLNALLGWIALGNHRRGLTPPYDAWVEIRYDLTVDYAFDSVSREFSLGNLAWSAPDWGDLTLRLDASNLPELRLPELPRSGRLEGPVAMLRALVEETDFDPVLLHGAAFRYEDQGTINRVLDGIAAATRQDGPQYYFLDLRDRLKARIESDQALPWDQALLDMLLGHARIEASVTPELPMPMARVLRLPEDAAGTLDALGVRVATSGARALGHFAISESEERALHAKPFVESGESAISAPDLHTKFFALSAFLKAVSIAPDDPRATEGLDTAIEILIREGARRETEHAWFGTAGAIAVYHEILRRMPENAKAKAALAAVPGQIAAAAMRASANETFVGADMAFGLLRSARTHYASETALAAACETVAGRLVKRGDLLAQLGAPLADGEKDGALTYYARALELRPDSSAALQALDALAERLKQAIAQQLFAGDKDGAAARVAAIKEQWPQVPGRDALETQLAVMLSPPEPKPGTVAVYNWADYIGEFTNHRFEQKTGITVQYDTYETHETLETKLVAGNSGYDVVVPVNTYLGGAISAGVFRKLDKSKLPNLANLDPAILKASEAFDPGNAYSVPYMWGTIGVGYNINAIKKRMRDAPVDSWRMVLDPEVVSKFEKCGVAILDSPAEILLAVLVYLGKDANTEDPEDYEAARRTLAAVRPYIRYFHPAGYIKDLGSGKICLAIGWSGDVAVAQARADRARNKVKLRYVAPVEGTLIWTDSLAVPADAPHPDAALAYIDYLLDPQTAADNANYVGYASPNKTALDLGLINAQDRKDPALYPPPAVMERLVGAKPASPELEALRERVWAAIKAGE